MYSNGTQTVCSKFVQLIDFWAENRELSEEIKTRKRETEKPKPGTVLRVLIRNMNDGFWSKDVNVGIWTKWKSCTSKVNKPH